MEPDSATRRRRLSILYGSQTGTAQSVAERIYREAKRLHFEARISAMDDFQPVGGLLDESLAVFVCSTTGQGQEPSNMARFWKFLLRRSLPGDSLEALSFGVLGLGDSSYQKFNFVAKRLQKRLVQLGARPLLEIGLADDQHDLGPDAVVDPWLAGFWPQALRTMPLPPGVDPIPASVTPTPRYLIVDGGRRSRPPKVEGAAAQLESCERLTADDHFQDTRLVQLKVEHLPPYHPGDVCTVQPRNLSENVEVFFELFPSLDPGKEIDLVQNDVHLGLPPSSILPTPCTLLECAERLWDLQAIPGRYFFELLSHFSPRDVPGGVVEREKLLELSTSEGQQDLYEYCNRPRRNMLDVLQDFHFTRAEIPVDYLFDLFPTIKPRAFSIASSYEAMPGRIQLLVAVVNYRTKLLKAPRLGLCSNWLTRLHPGDSVPVVIKRGTLEFPPAPVPVVMVGPGTGIAPFRSYCTKETRSDSRSICVFFGCRGRRKDFYFEREWTAMMSSASNFRMFAAFSRDRESSSGGGAYVQHVMEDNSKLLFELIHELGGWFYIAGKAKQMPEQVRDALKRSLEAHGDFRDEEEVERYVTKMEKENRFQTETWS